MDTKKEQERDELHRAIWAIADDLRGSVDGWDFKSYVLGFMFYRYISENLTNYINKGEHAAGNTDFDYALLPDEEAEFAKADLVNEKGFFIKPSELFCNIRKKAPNDENLNETLEKVFRHIEESAQGAESEDDFAGLFDDIDVNSNKLGGTVIKRNERLVKILNGVGDLQLGDYQDNTIDAFGDAYEFLMGMYASNAGKSGGEYFTPQEVSELLTRIAVAGKTEVNKVYDPACGSGSLLLKAAKVLGKDAVRQGFYGQEINITTYNLCRINMFLHDIDYDKFNIANEDTLINPQHWDDEPFEAIVSNPPYSIKWEGDDNPVLLKINRCLENEMELCKIMILSDYANDFFEESKKVFFDYMKNSDTIPKHIRNSSSFEMRISFFVGGMMNMYKQWFNNELDVNLNDIPIEISKIVNESSESMK